MNRDSTFSYVPLFCVSSRLQLPAVYERNTFMPAVIEFGFICFMSFRFRVKVEALPKRPARVRTPRCSNR